MKYLIPIIMRPLLSIVFGLSLFSCCITGFCNDLSDKRDTSSHLNPGETLKIMSSPELNDLTMAWIREYSRLNPSINFSVGNIVGNQTNKKEGICFVSDDYSGAPGDHSAWKISIGHDAIVPVFSAKNPMLHEISNLGISIPEFAKLFSGAGKLNWSDLITGGQNRSVNACIIDNAEIIAGVSRFIQTDPAALKADLFSKTEEFIAAIRKDPYAIGFCKLSDIRRKGLNELTMDIRLVPIDKNGNGRIDHFENIYSTPDDLSRGVWIGKYPHALSGSIYALSQTRPTDKNALAFLTWIITDGGQYLASGGYSDLISMEKQANLAALLNNQGEAMAKSPASLSWLVMVAWAIVAALIVFVFILIFTRSKSMAAAQVLNPVPVLNENSISSPKGLYHDRTHTWAFMERDGIVRLGIDDFLLHVTGPINRVIMKEPGEIVRRGEKMLTIIKDGKQLNLYAPVSGTIKAQNTNLNKESSGINTSPYSNGWIYLVEPKNWLREIQFMFMGDNYREWLREEFIRLRKFFEANVQSLQFNYNLVVLQDGGELKDNILAEMGPEVWEDFQSNFIDPSR
jgi:glycine cleavage system H lipoate-binding protein/ABC-type phosphate transport system substrate-binding protein